MGDDTLQFTRRGLICKGCLDNASREGERRDSSKKID
jgi:hypothetical protein